MGRTSATHGWRIGKRALNHWLRQALPNFEASLAYEMINFLGPDAAEGLAALQEKVGRQLLYVAADRESATRLQDDLALAGVERLPFGGRHHLGFQFL